MRTIYVTVHIPKCGGRSLYKFFREVYGDDKIVNLYDNKEHISKFYKKQLDLTNFAAVCGHVTYGIEEYLDRRTPVYLAMVREPLERFVSFYNYLLMPERVITEKREALHNLAKSCRGNIEMFYHGVLADGDKTWSTSNIQASYLTGSRACSIDSVINCVERGYRMVVPLSRISWLFEQLAAEIGVPVPRFPPENTSDMVASTANTSPEFREMFRRRADLDYFTYHYVAHRTYAAEVDRLHARRWLFNGWPRSS